MKSLFKRIIVAILTIEAKITLKRHKPTVVAVTGSVGKTSTKDAIFAALKDQRATRKSQKSFNSEIGVPLTVLGLPNGWSNPLAWLFNCVRGLSVALFSRHYPEILVLETGVDQPGDMQALTSWLKANVVVVTRLPDVPVHVEFFSDADAMRREEFSLVNALTDDGVLVYNVDDENIEPLLDEVRHERVSFGRMLQADVKASGDEVVYRDDQPTGVRFTVVAGDVTETVTIAGTVGLQSVYATTAALAVAKELGCDLKASAASLSASTPPPGRMRIIPGLKGSLIIDDSYNASPVAVEAALESLHELKYVTRRIAVLGDMLELGKFSSEAHRAVGEHAARVADVLLTIGPRSREIAAAALAHGMDESVIFQYETSMRAGRELQTMLKTGDAVLVKASQRMRTEKIVEEVMAEPERASDLLCRQDDVWRSKA